MHPGHRAKKILFHNQPFSNDKINASPVVVSKIVIQILVRDLTANTPNKHAAINKNSQADTK